MLLLLLTALLAVHAADGWRYLHDDNGRRFSSYARSHLELGLGRTRGQDFFYDRRTGRLVPYGHHPPGLGLALAGWFRTWGRDTPLTARALAASSHLLSAGLLIRLVVQQYPGWPGLVGALAVAVVPMSSFFGKMVNYEPFVLPAFVLLVVGYWRWAEGGARGAFAVGLALAPLGALFDWPILLALLTVAADAARRWVRERRTSFLWASVAVGATGLATFLVLAAWLASGPAGARALAASAAFRGHLPSRYSRLRWLGKILEYHRRYFTEPALLASVALPFLALREAWAGRQLTPRARLVALFGVAGVLPVLVFPNGARYHPYWQFYLLPFAALGLAQALELLETRLAPGRRPALRAGVVLWILCASAVTLWVRYTQPSTYVEHMLAQWREYL